MQPSVFTQAILKFVVKRIPHVDNAFQIWLLVVWVNGFFVLKPVETIQNALKTPTVFSWDGVFS